MKCWKHTRRRAVACGTFTKRGYCRGCWPESAPIALTGLGYWKTLFWPNPVPQYGRDAALWLAA